MPGGGRGGASCVRAKGDEWMVGTRTRESMSRPRPIQAKGWGEEEGAPSPHLRRCLAIERQGQREPGGLAGAGRAAYEAEQPVQEEGRPPRAAEERVDGAGRLGGNEMVGHGVLVLEEAGQEDGADLGGNRCCVRS